MRIQSTFKNKKPTIFLVGTPIGNLEDISFRAIDVLKNVDLICCEDTRTSQTFLSKYNIKNKLISLHKFNENQRVKEIVENLKDNKNIAIISDAGCPAISDPGAFLINQILKEFDCNITSVNVGPAYIHAIVASGYTNKENYFYGFINNKTEETKINELKDLLNANKNSIISFYESVHRIQDTIEKLNKLLEKEQSILIGRELTKLNEEYIQGTIEEVLEYVNSKEFTAKGEFVVVIDVQKDNNNQKSLDELISEVKKFIEQGYKLKQACEMVSKDSLLSKNELYNYFVKK